ncbi:MAG: sulfurtransferase [Pseudomonadota bacterium]
MSEKIYNTLIDCAALDAGLANPHYCDFSVFDCRHPLADPAAGERAYLAGHLPGAHFLHLDRDLAGMTNGHNGRHPLPDPQQLAQTLAAKGVSQQTQVIAYDDAGGMVASRLWWLLRWLGHESVAVLDGGFKQWCAAGYRVSTTLPAPIQGNFSARMELGTRLVGTVNVEAIMAHLQHPQYCLIDARSAERFRGENETLDPVGGHIPGALNRFFQDNLQADSRFHAAAKLRADFLALLAGAAPEQVVMQCGSGVSACHNLLAMEHAGLTGAKLYPGSWSEWCSDPARPTVR